MPKKKVFKWVVEFTIDETLVADGFDPNDDDFRDSVLSYMLGYAYPEEVQAKIIKKPNRKTILKAQGYSKAS